MYNKEFTKHNHIEDNGFIESTPLNIGPQRAQVGTQKFRNHVNSLWKGMTIYHKKVICTKKQQLKD